MMICERCGDTHDYWLVERAELRVGRIHRLPHLCRTCARVVEDAVQAALVKAEPPAKETR